jgi:hypothetical protein
MPLVKPIPASTEALRLLVDYVESGVRQPLRSLQVAERPCAPLKISLPAAEEKMPSTGMCSSSCDQNRVSRPDEEDAMRQRERDPGEGDRRATVRSPTVGRFGLCLS